MKTISFTHGTTKRPVEVVPSQIFSFYVAEKNVYTYIIASGGGIIPVSESPELIKKMLEALEEPTANRKDNLA